MYVIDLSVPLNEETRVQGEDTGYQDPPILLEPWLDVEHKYKVTKIELGAHAGTHCDVPSHVVKGGKTIGDYAIEHWIGWALVMDFRNRGPISVDMLLPFKSRVAGKRQVIPVLRNGFTDYLTSDARAELISWRPQAIVMGEGINIDDTYADTFEFLEAGVPMVMNADYRMVSQIEDNDLLIAAPLKFVDIEAAPTRLIAIRGLSETGHGGVEARLTNRERSELEEKISELERLVGKLTVQLNSSQ